LYSEIFETTLADVVVFRPKVHEDHRGNFSESYNQIDFEALFGKPVRFVQDNEVVSVEGTLRGMHFQSDFLQGKLVRVSSGRIFDVCVDLRRPSSTFGKWFGIELCGENRKQMWVPPGFAHGYLALSDECRVHCKTSDYWKPDLEETLRWNDPKIGIKWPETRNLVISDKDQAGKSLDQLVI